MSELRSARGARPELVVNMEKNYARVSKTEKDLGIDVPFIKGQEVSISNCWHFSTDGREVDAMFMDAQEFRDGMNRIYPLAKRYEIDILAFSLMDTHVHFILHGSFDHCNRFMHEYVKQTSWAISHRRGERHKLRYVPIHHQVIDTDQYLKTAICYVIKNAPVGGIPFNACDYPWSSAALYFKREHGWTAPKWLEYKDKEDDFQKQYGIVFPGKYVDYQLVEKIFKTHKSFNYFMCISRERDIESRGGAISHLSLPMQEMRQHKTEVCLELYGVNNIRLLTTEQRLRLAKVLKARYNSSVKQLARLCGLVYTEVKDMI